ncbi:MAG: hypothetical protein AAGG68_23980 [Bacteroidota bacterium]
MLFALKNPTAENFSPPKEISVTFGNAGFYFRLLSSFENINFTD